MRENVRCGTLYLPAGSVGCGAGPVSYTHLVVFQYTTAQPEKKKLQAIQEAAVQAVQENYAETPHVEAVSYTHLHPAGVQADVRHAGAHRLSGAVRDQPPQGYGGVQGLWRGDVYKRQVTGWAALSRTSLFST